MPFVSSYRVLGSSYVKGRRIAVVPSQNVLIKKVPGELKSYRQIKEFVTKELSKISGTRGLVWKVWQEGDERKVILAEVKGDGKVEWDAEPVALARVLLDCGLDSGEVLDVGYSKSSFVRLKNGKLETFRCYPRGYRDAGSKGLSEFLKFLIDYFKMDSRGPLLLSGGLAESEEFKEVFSHRKLLKARVPSYLIPAFGAALRGIRGKHLPSLSPRVLEVDPSQLKSINVILSVTIFLLLASLLLTSYVSRYLSNEIKKKEVEIFKKHYPNVAVVSPLKQLLSVTQRNKNEFYYKMSVALEKLPKGIKIIELNFSDDELLVKVETKEDLSDDFKERIVEFKKLPDGSEILVLRF